MSDLIMSKEDVLDYIEKQSLGIFLSYTVVHDEEGNLVEPVFEGDDELAPKEYMKETDTLHEYWGVRTGT